MNKTIFRLTAFVTMIVANHLALLWLPWYSILPITAIIAYLFNLKSGEGALMGFLSLFLLWTLLPIFTDISNNFILSTRIGELFGGLSSFIQWIITGLIGGIGGCIGGLFGGLVAKSLSVMQI